MPCATVPASVMRLACTHRTTCAPAAYVYVQVRAASSNNGAGNGAPEQYDFDLFTIGAGSGGTRASRMAAQNHGRV
jgi:hypothetical protein